MFSKDIILSVSATVLVYVLVFTLGSDVWRAKHSRRYRAFFWDLKEFKELARLQGRTPWTPDSCIIYPDFRKQIIEEDLKRYPASYTPDIYLNLYILCKGIGEDGKLDLDCRLMAARNLLGYRWKSYVFEGSVISREELEEYLNSHGEKV